MKIRDIVKVKNRKSPQYTFIGAIINVRFGLPYDDITVAFGAPVSASIMFSEDELELFLEADDEDKFCVGDAVTVTDKFRGEVGMKGSVTKIQPNDNVVFVLIEGADMPIWFFDHQINKTADLLP